ncbi:MAG: hypothetical protein H6719_16120 [Sandaracinaceae bacterium]|nr:hypothetical protein [Sandaracinaceae bacterium]
MQDTPWNHPSKTWRLASYAPPTERRAEPDRRGSTRRAVIGDRRAKETRSLRSIFRL